ncbi:hypothetical protein ACQP1W_28655 [Spirillospora sp. CA-255316]
MFATDLELSPAGDTELSDRALREVRGRVAEVAAVPADRAAGLRAAGQAPTEPQATVLIEQAVAQVPALPHRQHLRRSARQTAGRVRSQAGRELYAEAAHLGALALEIAPAYLSEAPGRRAPLPVRRGHRGRT